MSQHLSSQQISMWMAGERTPEAELHVRECADCAAELDAFARDLALFRDAVRQWQVPQPVLRPARVWPMRLALTVATLLLVALIPVYRFAHPKAHPQLTAADAALLEQVDVEVSRAVPRPMEPLLELASAVGEPNNDARKDNHAATQHK